MKIVGMLLILNALFLTAWWVCTDHPYKPGAISAGLIAIFVGIYFMVQDRAIEITIEKVGTIKAAAEQATVDAQAVAKLRSRIEAQSSTVDLVAQSATKAHKLIEDLLLKNRTAEAKINELGSASSAVQETVSKLKETAEFMALAADAQNDDRRAFEKLSKWERNKTSPYWEHALGIILQIRTGYNSPFSQIGYLAVPWPKGTDPKKLSLIQLKQEYKKAHRFHKAGLVDAVWKSEVISKKEKMSFFVDILRDDESLCATHLAGKYFAEASSDSNLKWSPFLTKPLLDWWAENHNNLTN